MCNDERISNLEKEVELLKKEIEKMKFRFELKQVDSNVNDVLYDYDIDREQYRKIMDVMDECRKRIDANEAVSHSAFETQIKNIVPEYDYHFAEFMAQAFMNDGRWEEVFQVFYGNMAKYKSLTMIQDNTEK